MPAIPFCGPSYEGRSTNFDSSRCINFFVETATDQTSKSPMMLVGTPGTKTLYSFPSGRVRLLYNFAGRCFAVVGSGFYELYSNGKYSARLGNIGGGGRDVYASDNGISSKGVGGNQLLMVTNKSGYIYDISTNAVLPITDPGFPANVTSVTYQDGYFIVTNDTMGAFSSALYDGFTWPGLAFASINATPDSVQVPVSHHQQLFFFKEVSTEVWYNAGTPTSQGFPFARVQGAVIDFGTPAPKTVVKGAGTIFFLANVRNKDFGNFFGVATLDGYNPQLISPTSINYRISKLNVNTAEAYVYTDEGHIFYVLTFPADDITFVFDATTKMWHERSTTLDGKDKQHRHISDKYTYFNGKHLVSDYRNSKILQMSSDYYDDDGEPIISVRITPPLYDQSGILDRFEISKLVLDMETGMTGMTSLQPDPYSWPYYYAPQAWLSWSKDGGHTWSNEYPASIGANGNYACRVMWRRLGISRNKVFKLKILSKTKKIIMGAYIDD